MSTPKITPGPARSSAGKKVFPLPLTLGQRQAVLDATRLPPGIVARLESLPSDAIAFSREELDQIADELGDAALEAHEAERRQLAAVLKKLDELLDSICREPGRPLAAPRPERVCDVLYQFKITLLDLEPAVWRRVQLEDGALADLHAAIQAAFGWSDERQHRFAIDGIAYGRPPERDFGFGWGSDCRVESAAPLAELAPRSGRRARWIYEYDFKVRWRHEVLFEGYPPKERGQQYPICIAGELACPPEQVGGPWGYVEFLQSLDDPREPVLELAESFDPEAFDPETATRAMHKNRKIRR